MFLPESLLEDEMVLDYFRMPQSRNKLIITLTLIGWVVLVCVHIFIRTCAHLLLSLSPNFSFFFLPSLSYNAPFCFIYAQPPRASHHTRNPHTTRTRTRTYILAHTHKRTLSLADWRIDWRNGWCNGWKGLRMKTQHACGADTP